MTRETKIGLLVGLAFIIVIGILLSDHMSSTNEPPQAALSGAGGNVRAGVASPGADAYAAGPLGAAPADAPRRPVPTRADLGAASRRPPVGLVQVGPGGSGAGPINLRQSTLGVPPVAMAGGTSLEPGAGESPVVPEGTPSSHGVQALARQNPDDLIAVDPSSLTERPPPAPPTAGGATAPPGLITAPRQYTAEPGDSVSRLAAKFLGGGGKANRDLIIRANPSLQVEGNPVIAGRVYIIPNPGTPLPAAYPAAPGPVAVGGTDTAAGQPTVWYTVRENDNLWKIAAEQCGSGNAWTTVKDLNKDILKGGETVRANMRIRIPARAPVANARD